MAKNNITPPDTLSAKFDTLRTGIKSGLMDFLGKDLYSVLESKEVKQDMPFGFKSKFDFRRKNLNLQKEFGNDYRFDLDINRRSPRGYKEDFRIGITKKF